MISEQDIIVFQGDSITDAGRDRERLEPNMPSALGCGYANLIAARLLHRQASLGLQIYNRGISGDRIVNLYARWKIDCLNLNPSVISILVGVNDTAHEFVRQNGVEVDRYENMYRELLRFTRSTHPEVRLILCEPFIFPCGVVTEAWLPDVQQRQQVVRQLAAEFEATFVPFQQALDNAARTTTLAYWLDDGIHPTAAGHHLLAEAWLEAAGYK